MDSEGYSDPNLAVTLTPLDCRHKIGVQGTTVGPSNSSPHAYVFPPHSPRICIYNQNLPHPGIAIMKNRNKTTKFPVVRLPVTVNDPICHAEHALPDFISFYVPF